MTIINIPLTLSSTAPTSMIPEVSALYATGDIEATRECIDQTVQLSMVVSAPCAMGLAVLAQPIVFLLYGNSTGLAANLLILGSFSILLNGMSNISNGVLQAIGQQRIPVITAAIAMERRISVSYSCICSHGNCCRLYLLWTEHFCKIQFHLSDRFHSCCCGCLSVCLPDHQQAVRITA